MPPGQQQHRHNNHSTLRSFVPSSSKVHKTCSSPSILKMMEESGSSEQFAKADYEEAEHRKSLILDDESSRMSLAFEDEPSRRSLVLDGGSTRKSFVFEDESSKMSSVLDNEPSRKSLALDAEHLKRSLVVDDEPSRKSLVLDEEPSRKSFILDDESSRKSLVLDDEPSGKSLVLEEEPSRRSLVLEDESRKYLVLDDKPSRASDSGLTCGEVAVTCPVINAVVSDVNSESPVAASVETPSLNFSSPKVNSPVQLSVKDEDDDKDNKGSEDVFATPLATPFGSADNNAPDVAEGGGGGEEGGQSGSGGFTSILKSFWKRTSFVWDDQEEQHCGDKEADDAAGSEAKQTVDIETDLREGDDDFGYKCPVKEEEVTEAADGASSDVPPGGESFGDDGVHLVDSSRTSETATAVVNNDSRIPGKCCPILMMIGGKISRRLLSKATAV